MFPLADFTNTEVLQRVEVSKRIVGMLSAMRRKAAEIDRERVFIGDITKCLEKMRAKGKTTPTQIEGLILYAIEKQQAWTLTEICEELDEPREIIKKHVIEMQTKGLVRIVQRHIPGAYKKNYLIKSNRIDSPDAI